MALPFSFPNLERRCLVRFHVDDYFHIGQMHLGSGKPCQDYSFSGVTDKSAFAVVSDGCSSGRHTDVGARVIALSTVNAIRQRNEGKESLVKITQAISQQHKLAINKSMEAFGLDFEDMLATCAYVYLTPGECITHVQGDGVVAIVFKNGSIHLTAYRWDENKPVYPVYAGDNYFGFINAHGGDLDKPVLNVEFCLINKDGQEVLQLERDDKYESLSLFTGLSGVSQFLPEKVVEQISFVAVFTDGVMQVDGINWKDVVLELLAFKNVEGEFAKRRMIRFIKDSKKDDRKGPLDDISYAVIRLDHDTFEEA